MKKTKHSSKRKGTSAEAEKSILIVVKAMGSQANLEKLFPLLEDDFTEAVIHEALKNLEQKGKIEMQQKGRLQLRYASRHQEETEGKSLPPKGAKQLQGIVDLTKSGAAYIAIENFDKDVYVPAKFTKGALHGDEVLIEITGHYKKKPEGKIVAVIKRNQDTFIGTLHIHRTHAFVQPEGQRVTFFINIPLEEAKEYETETKVIVRVTDWGKPGKHPVGEIIERLTSFSESDKEMKMILIQNGFHISFPNKVMKEARSLAQAVSERDCKDRLDYRDVTTFTIDPEDAKDFDDAISFKKLENGLIEIGVHIADVSHYVTEGSELDKEASQRGNSVYLPDRVCPMLPEEISNIVCSLRPNEDKLTFSALFHFNEKNEIKHITIAKTVIHSNRRFTYEQAQEVLETGKGDYAEELKIIHRITKSIRQKRYDSGAISFEKEEVRFRLDSVGKPLELYIKHRKDAHLLIEDLMLLANETIARFGSKLDQNKKHSPFVYRVHDSPDASKLEQFSLIASRFGYKLSFDVENPKQVAATINDLLLKVNGKPEQGLLEQMAIRSMAKAAYTTKNIGHYGLAIKYYTHFTSPIRRYPDLLVHRLVFELLQKGKVDIAVGELEEKCKTSSLMERKAMDAEREAVRYKQVEYLSDKIGNEYEGVVTGVIARGIFVEMSSLLCEGMISIENLGDEDFVFDEKQLYLRGTTSGTRYNMGDPIRVKVIGANLDTRKIDLEKI
ncbi:MAG: ribonuclease R [Bacteroidetes bacterium 37-13]|nr:MAG: ribonuclease R [Bacteroidetes bacterium 37-13]